MNEISKLKIENTFPLKLISIQEIKLNLIFNSNYFLTFTTVIENKSKISF